MRTQNEIDARDKLEEVVRYGTVLAQHTTQGIYERQWIGLEGFGCWLHPGEFLVEHSGNRYIVGMKEVS